MRDVQYNQRITRLFVLDHMVDLIDRYIGTDEANKVQEFYESWLLEQGGNYNEFKKLFTDIISGAKLTDRYATDDTPEFSPELVKYRFTLYLEYLFPPPIPT